MKLITTTIAAAFFATSAFAGNMGSTAMDAEPEMMAPEAAAGSMGGLGWILPLVVIGAIVAAGDD